MGNVAPLQKPNPLDERADEQASELPAISDSDLANAVRLAARHGADLRFTTESGWLVWDGRRFAVDAKAVAVQARAKETALAIFDEVKKAGNRDTAFLHAKRSQSKKSIDAMIGLTHSEPDIYATLRDFDSDPLLLNVANGTIDLRTGELHSHSRDTRITKLAPVVYDRDADFELWDSFLWRITGGREELYDYLRRLCGYLLTGLTGEQVLVFLYGPGANGKSVFCEVITAMLGEYGIVAMPDLVMSRKHNGIPNDVAALRGRRVAMMNETSQGGRFDEAKLKHLTGGDTLTGRFLHREFFDFTPTHKLIIRGNHKPAITGTDEGIWRRLHLVPFDVQIAPEDQDKGLLAKLTAELPGVLRWSVEGCLKWQEQGLAPPDIVRAAVRDYRQESDTLGKFIEERCEVEKLAQVKSGTLFSEYRQFCERAAERWIPAKDLPGEMRRRGYEHKRTNAGSLYLGIKLKALPVVDWTSE